MPEFSCMFMQLTNQKENGNGEVDMNNIYYELNMEGLTMPDYYDDDGNPCWYMENRS